MNVAQADKILSPYLEQGPWSETTIKGAFAKAVKANHPDLVADGQALHMKAFHPKPPPAMADLKEARDRLLAHYGANFERPPCPVCKGSGYQVGKSFRREACIRGCAPPA